MASRAGSPQDRNASFPFGFAVVAAIVICVLIALALRRVLPDRPASSSAPIAIVTAPPTLTTLPPPAASPVVAHGAVIQYELLGIDHATGVALIAPHDGTPRPFHVGSEVAPGLVVAEIRRGSVRLRDGDRLERLDLPSRLGGSGEPVPPGMEGLLPEPQAPSGEASGALIAARLAASEQKPGQLLPVELEQGYRPQ